MPSLDALSPSRSMSADVDRSDTDFDLDFSSSDDEAGVFFGTPKAVENKIVAALSKSITATPLTRERPSAPRRSSARLHKRDSREFLRRKTLLLSTPGAGPSSEKMWEGGFHERTDEPEDEPAAGPSTPTVHHEDIAVDLDTLRLDTFPSSPEDDTHDHSEDFFDEEEEDKENTAVPEEWDGEEGYDPEDDYVPAPPESVPMTIGFREGQYDLDLSPRLDMGGLSLLDIDDPEEVPLEFGNDTGGAGLRISLGASTSSMSSDTSIASASRQCPLQPNTPSPARLETYLEPVFGDITPEKAGTREEGEMEPEEGFDDEPLDAHVSALAGEEEAAGPQPAEIEEDGALDEGACDSSPTPHVTPDLQASGAADDSISSPESLPDDTEANPNPDAPRAPSPFESLDLFSTLAKAPSSATKAPTFIDTTADLIAITPLKPNGPTDLVVDPDLSYASDMDSPVGRAPVMIPVFTVASPPKRSSVMRNLEPMLIDELAPFDADIGTTVALPALEDPFGLRLSPFFPRPTAGSRTKSPSKSPSLTPTRQSPAETARVKRSLARRAAAKEQIENLGKSRLGTSTAKTLARADRLAASSSRLLSKTALQSPQVSAKSKAESPAKPLIQSPEIILKDKGKAPERPKPTGKVTQPKPFALSGPRQKVPAKRPAPALSGLPRPTSGLPRPALKRPAVAAAASAVPVPGKLFRMAPKAAAPRPVEATNPLKRPHVTSQAGPARAAASVAAGAGPSSRLTLGMPSRFVREPASGIASFSSMGGSGLGGALSHPPAKSPGKMLSPSRSALGKPYRPTGMTPIASRTAATPQRGLTISTPSKAFKLGTPSRPAATPKQRARMSAVSEERRLSCTPIRGEEPPSPPKWISERMDVDKVPPRTEPAAEAPVSEMPANAEARTMASPPPSKPDSSPVPATQGVTSLSPEAGKSKEPSTPLGDKEATPPPQENSTPPNPEPPAEHASASDSPPKEEASQEKPAPEPEAGPPEARRSMRTRTPRQSQEPSPKKPKAPPAESIVPGMTERALKTATTRNTLRNQMYLCTIDRQIVRVSGERPPSPTSGIRTIAEREAEEQKAGREARAKRRARGSLGEPEDDEEGDDEGGSIEHAVLGRRAPGDDEDYKTPVRPSKRAKLKNGLASSNGSSSSNNSDDGERPSKRVRWDEGLMIIRGGLRDAETSRRSPPSRSCVTPRARYPLDEHGNAVDRPTEKLRRTTVRVNAVFYEGEEPVAFEYNRPASGSGKRKGRK